MARTLRYIGLVALAASAWMLLAEGMGWVSAEMAETGFAIGLRAGLVCLLAGLALGGLAPLGRALSRGRCARCGAPIERGQTYCLDHLQATINEYRDRARNGVTPP